MINKKKHYKNKCLNFFKCYIISWKIYIIHSFALLNIVVTIALGLVLASVVLNQNILLADGVTAILIFIGLQFLFTWLAIRITEVKSLITSRSSLIFYKGNFLYQALKKERISVEEIYSAARQKDLSTLDGIDMIVLETTGDIAIIEKITDCSKTTFKDVSGT